MRRVGLGVGLALLLAGASGCGGVDSGASTQDARVPVRVEPVVRTDLVNRVQLSGRLRAAEVVEVRPKLSGRIVRFHALEGERVEVGQQLVELDTTELALELQRAEAALAQTRARRDEAERKRKRVRELFERKISSRASLDGAEAEAQIAEADRLTARAGRDLARQRLADARITAPIAGVLQERRYSVGDLVTPSGAEAGGAGGPIFTLIQTDPLQLEVHVSEKEAPRVARSAEAVPIRVDAFPEREFEGRVEYEAPSLDPVAFTQLIRLRVPNPDGALKPGMFARLEAVRDVAENALVVPADALVDLGDTFGVYVVDERETARLRGVRTHFIAGNQAAIASGLEDGDRVVVEGKSSVREGTEVRIVDPGVPDQAS